VKLNKDQEKAANNIVDFIEGKLDLPFFTLTGAPGTGKSFMLKEALLRTNKFMFDRCAATIAHSAKNVLNEMLDSSIPCFTVAQWLGLRMNYSDNGEILFVKSKKAIAQLANYKIAILDEASMINDDLFNDIMHIVNLHGIKLIVVGDIFQLPPVKQNHDSKFFDKIDATLTIPMRFSGPIADLASIYRDTISDINNGYAGDFNVLSDKTNRISKFDSDLDSGYFFKSDLYKLVEQAAYEIKANPDNVNFSRMLAYKNANVDLLNKHIRKYIYGNDSNQFEYNEILISRGGFSSNNLPLIHNGKILRVQGSRQILGPYKIPCVSLKFKGFNPIDDKLIPIVQDTNQAQARYASIKEELLSKAKRDPKQWIAYYKFLNSFAYFDYGYAQNLYKAQGQTIHNVYVMEGEVMNIKPLTLKQKFQALYVAVTRAKDNVYIYNKNY